MDNTEYTHPAETVTNDWEADGMILKIREYQKKIKNQEFKNSIQNKRKKARQEIERIGLAKELTNAGLNGWATKQEKQVQENDGPSCRNCGKDMRAIHQHDGADDYYEFWICDDCQFKLSQ